MTSPGYRIALMGPYGFGNLGDAAIQQAAIQNFRRLCPGAELYGISQNPEDTEIRHHIPAFPLTRTPGGKKNSRSRAVRLEKLVWRVLYEIRLVLKSWRFIRRVDLLVASGGGQLSDYWGGPWGYPYALFKWACLARLTQTRFVVMSVGAGPLDHSLSQYFIREAFQLASYRSLRDEKSRQHLEQIGLHGDHPVVPDLAFSLKFDTNTGPAPTGQPVIGINPMIYLHPRLWARGDRTKYVAYLKKLALFVETLIDRHFKILFFPGVVGGDEWAIRDLIGILKQSNVPIENVQYITPPVKTVADLLSALVCTQAVVASRYHGVLLAQLLAKPVLAISYDPKVEALMDGMGLSEFCLTFDRFSPEALTGRFEILLERALPVSEQIAATVGRYRQQLEEQYRRVLPPQGND